VLAEAWLLLLNRQYQSLAQYVGHAERLLEAMAADDSARTDLLGEAAILRGYLCMVRGDVRAAIACYHEALAYSDVVRANVLLPLGGAYRTTGHDAAAIEALTAAADAGEASDNLLVVAYALAELGYVQHAHGHLQAAAATYERLVRVSTARIPNGSLPLAALAHVGLGALHPSGMILTPPSAISR